MSQWQFMNFMDTKFEWFNQKIIDLDSNFVFDKPMDQ